VSVQNYRDDYMAEQLRVDPYLTVGQALLRLHSLLAHARIVGEETPGVEQVLVRMDWRGLAGRPLITAPHGGETMARAMAGDRFARNLNVPWPELRDQYFEALRRVALAFFDVFPNEGWTSPERWLTHELARTELTRVGAPGQARLFGD
jgi:hypothetical protein